MISVLEISENHKYSSVGQSSYPSFGLKIQGLFKDIFHFSSTPRTAKSIGIMIVFTCCLLLGVATVLPVAYIFTQGTLESMLDEISYKIQGLSSTDCNFQGLSRPCIFLEIQGLSRRMRTLVGCLKCVNASLVGFGYQQ